MHRKCRETTAQAQDSSIRAAPAASTTYTVLLEQDRVEASHGTRVRECAARQSAADDDDIGCSIPSIARKGRNARIWKLMDPG
jgi:hypothetical protein